MYTSWPSPCLKIPWGSWVFVQYVELGPWPLHLHGTFPPFFGVLLRKKVSLSFLTGTSGGSKLGCFFFFFLVRLGFELRASCLTLRLEPTLQSQGCFSDVLTEIGKWGFNLFLCLPSCSVISSSRTQATSCTSPWPPQEGGRSPGLGKPPAELLMPNCLLSCHIQVLSLLNCLHSLTWGVGLSRLPVSFLGGWGWEGIYYPVKNISPLLFS
jgi:hypothetical protein